VIRVYRYRVKNLNGLLNRQARAVNYVWNYCNESQRSAIRLGRKWLTAFDLGYLTAGTSVEIGLHSDTISSVCRQYVLSRFQKRLPHLRWRGKKNLGWIPLRGKYLREVDGGFKFHKRTFKVFMSRRIPDGATFCDGSSFSQDAAGRWFLNIAAELPEPPKRPVSSSVGIDLGLKDLATLSNGEKIENPRHLARLADKMALAQRARKKRLAASIHAKIKNTRKDFHHKLSTRLVKQFDYIAVGNVSPSKLAKTRMAKSVLDAGWSAFRNKLRYKAIGHGATFEEVNESHSTQVCSSCGCLPMGRPEGIAGLGIRAWSCSECGASHDRDVNSAINILFGSGHRALAVGACA